MGGRCVVCGCTDEAGCAIGCAWFEPDLCTACLPSLSSLLVQAAELEKLSKGHDQGFEPTLSGSKLPPLERFRAHQTAWLLRGLAAVALRLDVGRMLAVVQDEVQDQVQVIVPAAGSMTPEMPPELMRRR